MLEWLGAMVGIVLVDLALSGDNALVIGAAASELPPGKRRTAIVLGGVMAIVLRVALAGAVTLLLRVPLLQAFGGAVLLLIALRLLAGRQAAEDPTKPAVTAASRGAAKAPGFIGALTTIVVADVTMSLDNVLAVGALAAGNLPLLAGGLLLSMSLLLVGSSLVAHLIGRLPWLLDVAALVLGWTAAHMVLEDPRLSPALAGLPWHEALVPAAALALVLTVDVYMRVRTSRRAPLAEAAQAEVARARRTISRPG